MPSQGTVTTAPCLQELEDEGSDGRDVADAKGAEVEGAAAGGHKRKWEQTSGQEAAEGGAESSGGERTRSGGEEGEGRGGDGGAEAAGERGSQGQWHEKDADVGMQEESALETKPRRMIPVLGYSPLSVYEEYEVREGMGGEGRGRQVPVLTWCGRIATRDFATPRGPCKRQHPALGCRSST